MLLPIPHLNLTPMQAGLQNVQPCLYSAWSDGSRGHKRKAAIQRASQQAFS